MRKHHIPSLDGLRAVSILLVLSGHSLETIPNQELRSNHLFLLLANSGAGVTTFFVISGYLITYILRKEYEKTHTINLRNFYLRRVLRIFPAFYSYLGVVTGLTIAGILSVPPLFLASAATFSLNYSILFSNGGHNFANSNYQFIAHFWTLALEEQFYLLWPAVLLLLGLRRGERMALLIILVCPIIRVLSYKFWPEARGQIGMMLHTASDSLMIGCVLALWEGKTRLERFVRHLSNGYIAALSAFFFFVISPNLNFMFRGAYGLPLGTTFNSISIAIVLLYVTRYSRTWMGQILNSQIVAGIGVLSYSIYLWQQLFLTNLNTTWTGEYPFNLVMCFIVAILSHHLIEKPFLSLKNRIPTSKIGSA